MPIQAAGAVQTSIASDRLTRAKFAYTTRHVRWETIGTVVTGSGRPQPGDLVLARVTEVGWHKRLELVDGRRAALFEGDEIVLCYGNRYAPDQFEAEVPEDLAPCDLAAAGGVAARVIGQHASMALPTRLAPVGLLGDRHGRVVNLSQWALKPSMEHSNRPLTFAVVGSSMNAGKTTTAANLVLGLCRTDHKVGAAKVTGTGAGGDIWLLHDAGGTPVLDFTYAGYASTYRVPPHEIERIFVTLTSHLASAAVDSIVLEVADGLFQEETAALLTTDSFASRVDGVIFAAGDALGAAAGVEWLARHGLSVIAISGLLTCSPLAMREAHRATGLPVVDAEGLRSGGLALRSNAAAVA